MNEYLKVCSVEITTGGKLGRAAAGDMLSHAVGGGKPRWTGNDQTDHERGSGPFVHAHGITPYWGLARADRGEPTWQKTAVYPTGGNTYSVRASLLGVGWFTPVRPQEPAHEHAGTSCARTSSCVHRVVGQAPGAAAE